MTDSERLAVIETIVTELKHELMGNGQPGIINKHEFRIDRHESRIIKLENWRWWVMGLFGLGTGVGVIKILEMIK